MSGTRGVIWEHQLYEGFEYFQDRPYFHSFAGDVSSITTQLTEVWLMHSVCWVYAGMYDRNCLC